MKKFKLATEFEKLIIVQCSKTDNKDCLEFCVRQISIYKKTSKKTSMEINFNAKFIKKL